MPSTRILLVRHAASVHAEQGVYGGPKGCKGLNDEGRTQAARLGAWLAATESTDASGEPQKLTVYSSILPRSIETATIVAKAVGVAEVVQDCGLCSFHLPDWADGMSWEDIRRSRSVSGGGVFLPFEQDGEAWAELVVRVSRSLTRIASAHVGGTTIVVAHSEVVEASLITLGSLPLHRSFDVRVSSASVTEWVTHDDPSAEWRVDESQWPPVRWALARMNDTAHLAPGGLPNS